MKLESIIPLITIRHVAVEAVHANGERRRLALDTGDRSQRSRLYRFAGWRVDSLQAAVRHYADGLWPILVIAVIEQAEEPGPQCEHMTDNEHNPGDAATAEGAKGYPPGTDREAKGE